jgi:hypothetical protein
MKGGGWLWWEKLKALFFEARSLIACWGWNGCEKKILLHFFGDFILKTLGNHPPNV